jgi:hypothetical protein
MAGELPKITSYGGKSPTRVDGTEFEVASHPMLFLYMKLARLGPNNSLAVCCFQIR